MCDPGKAYFYQSKHPDELRLSPVVTTTRFVYDGDGGRVQKVTESGTTTYLGKDVEVKGSLITKYLFLGGQRIAQVDSSGKVLFYHSDHLGSSHVLTDSAGKLVSLSEYTPYGETARSEGTESTAHRFTGQEEDTETNLYYYGARYYDPEVGRFITPDNYIQDPSNPQSFNRYTYVLNNPVNLVDPTGNFSWGRFFLTLGAVALGAFAGAFVVGALGISAASVGGLAIAGGITGMVSGAIMGGVQGGWKGALRGGLIGAGMGLAAGAGVGLLGPVFGAGLLGIGGIHAYATGGWDGVAYFAAGLIGGAIGYTAGLSTGKSFRAARSGGAQSTARQSGPTKSIKQEHHERAQKAGLGKNPSRSSGIPGEPDGIPGEIVFRGDKVYRVYGDGASPYGNPRGGSFTRTNPNSVANYRQAAGLPNENTGRFMLEGEIIDPTSATVRPARSYRGRGGGIDEVVIPNAASKVRVLRISGVNPEF